jgi:hypothetical protein
MPLLRSGRCFSFSVSGFPIILTFTVVAAAIGLMAGCGSSSSGSTTKTPPFSGNTQVTVVVSSTANDQLSQFDLDIQSLTLTNQSGTTAPVLAGDWPVEFIHLNGAIEPVVALPIPQGIYTAATAVIGSASFTCLTVMPASSDSPGDLDESTYAYGYTPDNQVTVNLPSPITITGDSMGLTLNLQVSQSATFPSTCNPGTGTASFSINPTFNLTPMTFAAQPTNAGNGKVNEVEGEVSALGTTGSTFTLSLAELSNPRRTISVSSDGSTAYQGISNFSALQVGTFVDMDGSIQPDGSVLATRIAGYDATALNEMIGPLAQLPASVQTFYSFPIGQQGQTYSVQGQGLGVYSYSDSTVYSISGQMSNVASLPFAASFNASNMVTGQNVAIFSQQITDFYGGDYTPVTTLTLMPQIINGTVVGSAQSGSFTDYTVELASYNLFPILETQPDPAVLLNNPSQVEVYVDSKTQKLNTQTLGAGSTLRFYGLVFNDNGTLRMYCAQVNDGVAFVPPQSNSGTQAQLGQPRTTRRAGLRGMTPMITTITRSHEVQP